MKYWAFLSYSHTDKKWGDWLHKALETYRVPRRLVGKESRDGKVPPRVFPIFRDREELPVSADLGSNINEALQESRYLIVICSPRAAQSRWVGEENKTKQYGRSAVGCRVYRLTTKLSDAGGPARRHWQPTWPARVRSSDFVRCVSRETPFLYEIVSGNDAIVCVLKIVRELVSRLIQLDVIRAGHDHHDDAAVLALLDGTSELRSFRPELADRRIDVVAHQSDRVVTRVVVGFAFPFAVSRVARPTRSAPI